MKSRDTSRAPSRCRPRTRSRAWTSKASTPTNRRFIFYGGKGGVGKTTCAAARAIGEAAAGARVLAVSTDPAHSLGDALGVRLSARPRPVGRLRAAELDAPRAFARWIEAHRAALGDALEHGTWLDRTDVDALLDLPLPGIDELVGMLEIARLSSPYDVVVVDTAPTGHTLRLLAAPESVAAIAAALEALQAEHRLIREQLAGIGRPEAADRLIALLAEQARETGAALRDPARATLCWVTLPEQLSLAESVDGIAAIEKTGIRVAEVIVNRVIPAGDRCPICDARRAEERAVIAQIERTLGRGRTVRTIAANLREPHRIKALAPIAAALARTAAVAPLKRRPAPRRAGGPTRRPALSLAGPTRSAESLDVLRHATLLFVGGKGGVGKTTVAAALALRLARANPDRRMLLLSTDPAHSLADVLAAPAGTIGDAAAPVRGAPKNLVIMELDAADALAVRRAALEQALDEIASSFGAGAVDGRHGAELMDLAPPGVDELFGMLTVIEARSDYDVLIIDTAPTGHALRLLELPDAARQWVQVLLRVLLRYKSLVRPGQLAAELVGVSKSIRELQALLHDAARTRFLVVTRAAEVPRAETERLLDRLRRLKLAAPAVVVNARTLAPGRCRRCLATAAAERRSLVAIQARCRRRSRPCAIIQTPMSAPAPRGVRALVEWAGRWVADS